MPDGVWEFKRNYRNTPEIAKLGLAIAAMPFFRDVADMVEPDEFEPSGPEATLVASPARATKREFVIERALEAARTGGVGVLMGRQEDAYRFAQAFRRAQRLHKHMATWRPGAGDQLRDGQRGEGLRVRPGVPGQSFGQPLARPHRGQP